MSLNANTPSLVFAVCFLFLLSFAHCHVFQPEKRYLFIGHPYDWQDEEKVDPRLERLNYADYDQIWLGGDVCSATTKEESTVAYLDSIFNLSSSRIHWTLGNHDVKYGNVQYITQRTNRKTFYAGFVDDFTLLVLNTNLFHFHASNPPQKNCGEKEAQLNLIKNVVDTISHSSHLVILHHAAILNELKKDDQFNIPDAFNTNFYNIRADCDSTSYLTEWLYPKLKKVQERGVKVMLIGGDLGMRAKEYSFTTPDGVALLGSGINNSLNLKYAPEYVTNFDKDKVLILRRSLWRKTLDWEFVLLEALLPEEPE